MLLIISVTFRCICIVVDKIPMLSIETHWTTFAQWDGEALLDGKSDDGYQWRLWEFAECRAFRSTSCSAVSAFRSVSLKFSLQKRQKAERNSSFARTAWNKKLFSRNSVFLANPAVRWFSLIFWLLPKPFPSVVLRCQKVENVAAWTSCKKQFLFIFFVQTLFNKGQEVFKWLFENSWKMQNRVFAQISFQQNLKQILGIHQLWSNFYHVLQSIHTANSTGNDTPPWIIEVVQKLLLIVCIFMQR